MLCWACPHEGINLPPNWQDVEPRWKFLYMLILAMDANFRLCNKLRTRKRGDPELGPGWAYFVESTKYKDHVKNYVSETDVSHRFSLWIISLNGDFVFRSAPALHSLHSSRRTLESPLDCVARCGGLHMR